jgi:hypothetical protein
VQTARYFSSSKSENAEKEVNKSYINNQETAEETEKKCRECWENQVQITKKDDWMEGVSCRNWLHDFFSLYKDKRVDCVRKLLQEKKSKMQKKI